MTDAELELRLQALGPVEPPRDLQARVLAEVGVSPARIAAALPPPSNRAPVIPLRRWRAPVLVGALALAAATLFAVRPAPEVGDPTLMVARGEGEVAPSLGLRVAVRRGNVVERLAAGRAYAPGDTLLFRVSASAPMEIVLRRDQEVIYRGRVPAGDTDLPAGYALEAGQGPARLVVEGGGTVASVDLAGVQP